jgi:hypothetical protein
MPTWPVYSKKGRTPFSEHIARTEGQGQVLKYDLKAGGRPAAGNFLLRRQKKVTKEERPGLGLAQRGAGRGASCRKKHCKTGRYCCRSRTPSFADRVAAAPCLAAPLGFPLFLTKLGGCATRASCSDSARRRPGLGLVQRGAGRGASCCKKHCKTGRYCCRSRTPSCADRVAAAFQLWLWYSAAQKGILSSQK